jgi:FkbM family methyltransferase
VAGRGAGLWNQLGSPALRYRAFKDPVDLCVYGLHLTLPSVFFVQIGSNDAANLDPLRPFLHDEKWHGIMVEPVGYVFERLKANYGHSGRFKLENLAIADSNSRRDFYYIEKTSDPLPSWYDQLGSFSKDYVLSAASVIPDVAERLRSTQVECVTFDELCRRNEVGNIDLIHIDTEGFDLEILKLIDFNRFRPGLVIYEHKLLSETDAREAESILIRSGYRTCALASDTVAIPQDSSLVGKPLLEAFELACASAAD